MSTTNLNSPAITDGPLTAAELAAHNRRHRALPAGCDQQGRYSTRQWPDTVPTDHAPLVEPAELRKRAHGIRTLCWLCLASWVIPITLLAIATRCSG